MSNKPDHRKGFPESVARSCMTILAVFLTLGVFSPSVYGEGFAGMHLRLPENIQPGEEWPLRVTFDHAPPDHKFYRLFVKIDGTPVAFSDLSRERQTSINIPATRSGLHRLSLTWKNAPGRKAVVIRRTFQVPGH